jgi:hypothetical protein
MHITQQSYRGLVVLDISLEDRDTATASSGPLPRSVVLTGLDDDITWFTPEEAVELAEHLIDAAAAITTNSTAAVPS